MINPSETQYEGINYQVLDNGIHFLRMVQSNRQAAISLFALMEDLYHSPAEHGMISMLVDSTAASVPLVESVRLAGELEKKYPSHIPVNVALLQQHPLANILQTMLRPLRLKNQTRLFEANQREEAIDWLLAKRAEVRAKHSTSIHAR
jgi:hypothetical protein